MLLLDRIKEYLKAHPLQSLFNTGVALLLAAFYVFLGAPVPLFSVSPSGGIGVQSTSLWTADKAGTTIEGKSGAIFLMDSGSTVTIASGTTETHANTETHSGLVTLSLSPIISSESITPTNGATITPTKNIVSLTPAGSVGIALGACTSGTTMIIYDAVNQSIVITDTGTFIGAGNQTLGQYDALPAVCISGSWVQAGPVSAN